MESFLIYLLAIAPSMQGVAIAAAAVFGLAALLCALHGATEATPGEQQRDAYAYAKLALSRAVIAGCIAAVVPTPDAIITAYALVEGHKVVNAKNAEAVARDIGAKFDKLIDAVSGRSTEPSK